MGVLSNPKHEAFAQALARGMTADAAYAEAGYKPNRGNATTLKANQSILSRVEEIMEAAAQRSAKTLDDVIAEYERIAFTGLSKFVRIDADGTPQIDLSQCTPADLDLLSEIQTDSMKTPGDSGGTILKVKVKPLDRLKALDKLAAHLGMGDKAANQSTDRLADAIASLARKGSAAPIATASRRDP
jgi:phage terminase small subunit